MSKNLSSILRSGSNTPTVANSDIPALANPSTGYLNWTGSAYAWQPPIPYPQDGNYYQWDELTVSWVNP